MLQVNIALEIPPGRALFREMLGYPQPDSPWPYGATVMHARIRAHNWAATPVGPIEEWRPSLKSAVDIMLGTGFPTLLLWSKGLIQFSNDAYRLICAKGAPIGVGFPISWPEAWPFNAPIFDRVWGGESVVVDEAPFDEWQPGDANDPWYTVSYSPVRGELGEVAGIWITVIETTERVRAEKTLRESEARLAQILQILPVGVGVFDEHGVTTSLNAEMKRLFGSELSRVDVREAPFTAFDDNGRMLDVSEYPIFRALRGEIVRPGPDMLVKGKREKRWIKTGAVPIVRDGEIRGGIAVAHDITEAKESADRMMVLVAELQHRTRNLIAIVRAMAEATLDRSASLSEFRAKYQARLAALARVQGLLSNLDGARVTFDVLLRAELAAHAESDRGHVVFDGPEGVQLRSKTVQTLALALHELATNATKYGALCQTASRLEVRWWVKEAGDPTRRKLHVEWRERNVRMPEIDSMPKGFGRELIERVLPYQLNAATTYELREDGVSCTIALEIADDN